MVSSTCFDFQLKSPASAAPGSFRHPVQVFQGRLGSTHGARAGAGAAPGGTPGGEVGIPGRSWAICTLMEVHGLKPLAFPMFHWGFNRAWYVYINGICYVAKLVYSWFLTMVTMACDAYGNYIYIEWGLPPLVVFDYQRVYPLPTGSALPSANWPWLPSQNPCLRRSPWRRRPRHGHQGHQGQGQPLCRKWLGQRFWEIRESYRWSIRLFFMNCLCCFLYRC